MFASFLSTSKIPINLLFFGVFLLLGFSGYGQDFISIDNLTLSEGDASTTAFTFTVSVDGGGNAASDIDFVYNTADGTATLSDNDYVQVSGGSGTITAGTPSTTVTVQVNGDTNVEGTENFLVNLSAPVNATITDGQGEGTITNDDSDAISIDNLTLSEGDASTTAFTFTVSVDGGGNAASDIDFVYNTADGTATLVDNDYVQVSGGSGTITAGTPSTTVTVQVNGDTNVEGTENFLVNLSAPVNATITDGQGEGTITNDDSDAISIDNLTLSEGDASTTAFTFTVSVDGGGNAASNIGFTYNTANGTATLVDSDYVAVLGGSGTITAGTPSTTVTVQVNGDTKVEASENFLVNLSASVNATITDGQGEGTITNDDSDAISIDNLTLSEGDASTTAFTFTVSVDGGGNAASNIGFTYNTANGTATLADSDYVAVSGGSGTITSGTPSTTVTVQVNGDTNVEGTENFLVNLSASVNATITDGQGEGTITNDDSDAISIDNLTLSEGDASTTAFTFTVSVDGGGNAASDIDFVYNTANGTATLADSDYVAVSGGSGTITAGTPSTTVTVQVNGDTNVEGIENFLVNLSAPVNGTITDGQGEGTITNDDSDAISIGNVSLTEGNTGTKNFTFTVSVDGSGNAASNIGFTYNTANGTATLADSDYVAVLGGSGTITAGTPSTTVTVQVNGDTKIEGTENFLVNLSAPVNATITDAQGEGTITNDDIAIISINDPTPVNEGDTGTATLNFTITIDTSDPANDITVEYLISGGNEDGISDFLTFLAGTNTFSQQVPVTTNGDTGVEADEDISVSLSVPSANATISTTDNIGTSSFTDDDAAGLVINDIFVNEQDGTATFTITLNGNTFFETTVTYQTSDDTAVSGEDYTATSSSVTFVAGNNQTRTISIPIIDDSLLESDETFFVNLISSGSPFISIIDPQGIATIEDDDNCLAAPILDTDVSTLYCVTSATSVIAANLYDYTNTEAPGVSVLTWSPDSNPLNIGSHLSLDEAQKIPTPASYYGFFYDVANNCASETIEVQIVRNIIPTLTVLNFERCGPGTVLLSANSSVGATINWYEASDADTPIASGPEYSTPELTQTTSFFAEATRGGCFSVREEIIVTVGNQSSTGTATNGAVCNITTNGPTITDLDDRLTGASTGVWSVKTDMSNSVTINGNNEVNFAGLISGDYVFTFTTTDFTAPCTAETVDIIISVSDCNTDDDLDGLVTGQEVALGTDPDNPDTDGDGIEDGVEVGSDINNPLDEDNDGIIDALDSNILDTDSDGVNDQQDPANENPCIPNNSSADCPVDLEITKTADTLAALIGDVVTFTITVNNLTDKVVDIASVGDLLENGFEYVSQSVSTGVYDEVSGEWLIENLPALGSATLAIVVTVVEGGTYTNTAQLLESTPIDENASNDVSDIVVIETTIIEGVDLVITKNALTDVALVNDEVVYKITVTNESENDEVSQGAISQIIINDAFDPISVNFDIISSSLDKGTFDEATGDWSIPQLALNETATLFITIKVLEIGEILNTASLARSSPRDGDVINNIATVSVSVIEKTAAFPGFLYNQFSPNGNGQNEILRINLTNPQTGIDVSINYNIVIFDRYGSQIFEISKVNDGDVWDGTYKGKEAPKGTYFYVMKYILDGAAEVTEKGWIQLIR